MYKALYPNLFKPLTVNGVTLKNRIFSAPNMIYQTIDSLPTEYYTRYLEHKAKGGAAQVALGEVTVDDRGAHTRHFAMTRENMPMYAEMVAAIREHDAVPAIELCQDGARANAQFNQRPLIGPMDLVKPDGTKVNAMTEQDMEEVIEAFCKAIEFWQEAGFEAFMIHMGHNWLFSQFLSPLTNQRTDRYGGSAENRMRFPLMALKKIRERVGKRVLLEIRFGASDRLPGGNEVDFAIDFLEKAQEYVDLVEITSETLWYFISTTFRPRALNADLSAAIKASGRIHIPVIVVGAILDPETAEELIATGKADGVSMSRGLIADPYFPRKAKAGRADEITPCIRCCNCTAEDTSHLHFNCTVNPRIAREFRIGYDDEIKPAPYSKKVLIIGGGPAGMNAALTCVKRGHEVLLVEKNGELGGWLRFTDRDPLKNDLRIYKDFLIRRVMNENIKLMLNAEVTEKLLDTFAPDAIFVATGSTPVAPAFIKGYEKAFHAADMYFHPEVVQGDSFVMLGGGLVGIEAALSLAEMGKKVTVLEMADDYARDANRLHKPALEHMIADFGVEVITGARCTEITDDGVAYEKDGKTCTVKGDRVFYGLGLAKNNSLYFELADKAETVVMIGDCHKLGKVDGAVHSAYFAAMDLGTMF